MNISIIYWSGTGNTEKMAECIAEGAKSAGASVSLKNVSEASVEDVLNADVAILGCPSMGSEVLEESEFEPFMESVDSKISGKKIGLFGSYGWGDGEWMRDWAERVKNNGATLLEEPLIINEMPDAKGEALCKELGEKLAK